MTAQNKLPGTKFFG